MGAGPDGARAGCKPNGCICTGNGNLCTCATDGLHSREAGEQVQQCPSWSPFADMDQGLGLHDRVCSCQRCKHENGGDPHGSLGRAEMNRMQSSATPGPALVLHSDADRREFISAGAAGGLAVCHCCMAWTQLSNTDAKQLERLINLVYRKPQLMMISQIRKEDPLSEDYMQAAFGAPIGGVLFSMEEACTHWSRKVSSKQQPTFSAYVITSCSQRTMYEWAKDVSSCV